MPFTDCIIPLETDSSGVIRVEKTRVTLDSVVSAFQEGATPEEIVDRFPTIDLAAVYAVIAFYLQNQKELDAYLRQREGEAFQLRKTIESLPGVKAFRERLLARAKSNGSS